MAKIATIIATRNRPDLIERQLVMLEKATIENENRVFIVEAGTDLDKMSKYHEGVKSMWYSDENFKGKCYAHNRGLDHVNRNMEPDYYLFIHNDVFIEPGGIDTMIQIMDNNPEMMVLSPTEENGSYPDGKPRKSGRWHKVSTCDYLALLIGKSCVERHGFLNKSFKYCWGAIHEYAYKIYKSGGFVAYCDVVRMEHLGGSTYGKVKGAVSREEYQKRAKQFAANYFKKEYGDKWDEEFSKVLPRDIVVNTFKEHRKLWEG